MSMPGPKRASQERLRLLQEQEVHQYFRPWLSAHGPAFNVASNVESIAADDLQELGYHARRSKDNTLSAFAQLAALRLNVRRAMVSLIDSKHQYILTEATRTQSFHSDSRDDSTDALWLGNAVLKRDEAICWQCSCNEYTARNKNGGTYTARGLVVDDCRLDDRFKDRSYVKAEPGVRFYAGVPILTRDGIVIGAYAVSDEQPRAGLSISELKYMRDVSASIMEHLEWAKDRVDRFKSERIIRGLTSFIDGSRPVYQERPGVLNSRSSSADDVPTLPDIRHGRRHVDDLVTELGTERRLDYLEARETPHSDTDSDQETMEPSNKWSEEGRAKAGQEDIGDILTRAARSLRKSSLADGVLFFVALEEPVTDQDAAIIQRSSDLPSPDVLRDSLDGSVELVATGISLGATAEAQFAAKCTLSGQTLASYFESFPDGRAFHFTADGNEVLTDDEQSDGEYVVVSKKQGRGVKRARSRRQSIPFPHDEVLEKLPGVRKLIFLPLRDFITGKWIAGGFLWTTTFGRMMNMEEDLPHLKAYANGIVSEIVRMNVEQLSRSKTAFIASMSHELRSPLHGILGSVEFFNDTSLDSYQSGLVSSIANCSRTLLDTLSNLLSYAKVSQTQTANATARADIALLVEEVVESICAGHAFRKQHTANITALPGHNSPDALQNTSSRPDNYFAHINGTEQLGDVSVLLEIQPGNWKLMTNPGAFRRVVMNLVGNALKYTTKGFISVSLRATSTNATTSEVVLKVTDTGKGISGSFIKNNLFTPFKQEDALSSGTGLGLSIVKQLVESLRGKITVQSIIGKGTEFQVNIPMQLADLGDVPSLPDEESIDVSALLTDTRHMRTAVLALDENHSQSSALATKRIRASLADLCSSWYGMNVVKADIAQLTELDLTIFTGGTIWSGSQTDGTHDTSATSAAVVVLPVGSESALLSARDRASYMHLAGIVEIVSQPCGPRKLGKAMRRCLERRAQLPETAIWDENDTVTSCGPPSLGADMKKSTAIDHSGPPHSGGIGIGTPPTNLASRPLPSEPAPSAPPDPDARRVLLVDDNKVNMDLLTRFVDKFAMQHAQATNGLEAVEAFRAAAQRGQPFDYILMDVQMPGMDGLAATREIRRIEAEAETETETEKLTVEGGDGEGGGLVDGEGPSRLPGKKRVGARIVALSAHDSEDKQGEAMDSGVDIYLSKPIRFARLKEILERDLS